MSLFRTYQQGDLQVGIWKVDETIQEFQQMLVPFSIYESQFKLLKAPKRQLEWLAVRALLKEMCGEVQAVDYLPSGKPYLRSGQMKISFSHTKGFVAVALHPSKEVGVDIEQYGSRVKKVQSRFIRADEQWMLGSKEEIYALLLHWSAKETLYKLLQETEVDFLQHLQIMPFDWAPQGVFTGKEYCTSLHREYQIYYDTYPEFVLTYACQPD